MSRVVKLVYDDGSTMDLGREEQAVRDAICKASARMGISLHFNQENLKECSQQWYELSSKLAAFWCEIGCPKLPASYKEDASQYPSYRRC